MDHNKETIFALSSGRPPAAIAVVRISGPQTGAALEALIGRRPQPRRATLARVWDPEDGEIIDEALVLWFPGPNSATGEDVAELHVHGGRAVVTAMFAALGRIPGCRAAEPGEFTRRAFDNGKLDLTRVEGLADLIAADTQAQRRQAFRHLRGWLGERVEAWRTTLIGALALVEARIDFADEADVPENLVAPALASARGLREEIAAALADEGRGERLRDGVVVAIAGPPNAGKSSLLNRIARRDAAIVSPYPGTTRDVIEVHLDLGGAPVTFLDTAGIRDSDDSVEQEGVRRARARAAQGDLVLWVVDATEGNEGSRDTTVRGAEDRRKVGEVATWVVRNKVDLLGGIGKDSETIIQADAGGLFFFSAHTGEGLSTLVGALEAFAADVLGSAAEPALVTRARHREALQETLAAIDRALGEAAAGREEIIAEELRLAARALGRLIGRVDVEDVLDVIFRDFCIGK